MDNPVIDCLMNHRSIRKFQDRPVEPEVVETIITAGTRAATAGNLQLYSLIIVEDEETKQTLGVAHAPLAIAALADQHRVRRWFEASGVDLSQVHSHAARNLFIAYWDAIIVLQTIVVAAESLGLGTCYYGGIVSQDAAELFGAPEYTFPAGLVAIGYPAEEPELSLRLPLEAIVHRDRYRVLSDDELKRLYHERETVPWQRLPAQRQEELKAQGIDSIPKGVAWRKYGPELAEKTSRGMIKNLKRSGFVLVEY